MTPQALLWPVQGGHEIDASAEQAIIMKGVVLREFRRTGCRNQCDAEDTAGHPTDNRKNHGTEFVSTVYLESRQPPAIVPLEGHSEGSTPSKEHSGNYRRNASVADPELGTNCG